MSQIGFELARAIFRACCGERQASTRCRSTQCGEEVRITIEIVRFVNGVRRLARAGSAVPWWLRCARGVALAIDEVEFELDGRYRREPRLDKTLENPRERGARFGG